ncbi:hypothetical protein JVT61DRAFT_5867 [Boletus reticuloceps]|uniref:Uncharacterized protein n=1 Tax=Boletus reticuloceps TaxID=495285 RepID=A0A8I3A863_9AGAM|nr:hypothetical protein JVT61DRAFT_5867 [Boletus reticuloceps]
MFGTITVERLVVWTCLLARCSANNLTAEGTASALARPSQSVEGLRHKLSDTLLGIKGSMLRDKNPPPPPTDLKGQDPVAWLKLLLLVSFLTLHILNFTTTLAPATIAPFESRSSLRTLGDYQLEPRKVDITSPAIAIVLDTIAAFHMSNNFTTSSADVLVKVAPPLYISVIPPGPARPCALFRSSEIIDNFMSGWKNLVGDPVISKWIVFVLAASVVLNGYLLKGIAEGAIRGLQPPSVRFRSVGAVKRDRDVDEEIETPQARSTAIRRKPSFVVGPPKPKPGDSGATNTSESVPSPLLESKHLIAPTPIPAGKEISGALAFLLDMKLRVQPTAIVTKKPRIDLPARSLEECIEIFEHGPRPVQVSLSTLNDEEIILLAQDGKIAPYGLEKVLGDLERAVLIQRALILLGASPEELVSLFDDEFEEKVSRFAAEGGGVIYVVKVKEEQEGEANTLALARMGLTHSRGYPPRFYYQLTSQLTYSSSNVTSLPLIKRGPTLDPLTPLATQLHILNCGHQLD